MATLRQVKEAQPDWFSRKNKKFFNDIDYRVLHGKTSGEPYLVRATYAWSDMFGQKPRRHYRVNMLHDDLTIGPLFDTEYSDLWAVKRWLKTA